MPQTQITNPPKAWQMIGRCAPISNPHPLLIPESAPAQTVPNLCAFRVGRGDLLNLEIQTYPLHVPKRSSKTAELSQLGVVGGGCYWLQEPPRRHVDDMSSLMHLEVAVVYSSSVPEMVANVDLKLELPPQSDVGNQSVKRHVAQGLAILCIQILLPCGLHTNQR